MFGFLKHKNKLKNLDKVDGYKKAIKIINYFIAIYEWEKALKAINEIKQKESESYNKLIEHLNNEDAEKIVGREINKQRKIYEKKNKEISNLEEKLRVEKGKYDKKREKERFKVRFDYIRKEITSLTRTNKNESALSMLNHFLEEHKDKDIVIQFYNKQKKRLLINVEKQRKAEERKMKQNAKLEAMKLIGENIGVNEEEVKKKTKKEGFFYDLKEKFNFYKKIKDKLKKRQLLDEISLLIEEDSKIKNDLAEQKLENIHKGLIKEISQKNMVGYNFYGKILGADKISGDAFGFSESKENYTFFIGDATGHGIRAGFIITLLSRLFNESIKKPLKQMIYNINNGLKQDLKTRNFITGILFQIKKEEINKVKYVGMGHEPMLIYKKKTKKIEKLIPGGLAAGIRIIKEYEDVKVKEIILEDGDIVLTYSDGITEAKSEEGKFYGIDRLAKVFKRITSSDSHNISSIYDSIINDVKIFKGGSRFNDDVTLLLLERDSNNDIIEENSNYIKELTMKGKISKQDIKNITGKTKEEINGELEKIAKKKKIKSIIKTLENLYYTGEIIKLKQEAIRFIKDGFIDKKINFYLKKAIENEERYKIDQKEQRIRNKYSVLKELMKKEDYLTVIHEAEDIISKDGNI